MLLKQKGTIMIKKLLLITKQEDIQDIYLENLNSIFKGYIDISTYCCNNEYQLSFSDDNIKDTDIVLITDPYLSPLEQGLTKKEAQIICLNFTFLKSGIDELKMFPVGTKALVCFNSYEASHQAACTLYEAGIKNLNLYINYPDNKNIINKNIELGIISDYADDIPDSVKTIFDIGKRRLALSTILDIALKSNILNREIESRIYNYCSDIALSEDYLSYFYNKSSVSRLQLRTITNCIDYSIFIFDNDYRIIDYNKNALDMLNIDYDITKMHATELPWSKSISNLILSSYEFKNKLTEEKKAGKSMLISKEKVNKLDRNYDIFIILIKDITDSINLENTLKKQLIKKGHITKYNFSNIKGNSVVIKQCIEKAKRIAKIDKPTLIMGESGTGKELFAQSIHNESSRSKFPFIGINCAAITPTLLESELFGYEEGAFTGARKGGKTGLFQLADNGTLFLDEIGEISLETQAKLLRVLEEKEIMKIGSGEIISVDVRIIAATNKNLSSMVQQGTFRLDLYYRLNTLTMRIPPLRNRREDIPILINKFLHDENFYDIKIDDDVINFLMNHKWVGNVRELKNCIEYSANVSDGHITMSHLPDYMYDDNQRSIIANLNNNITNMDDMNSNQKNLICQVLLLVKKSSMGRRAMLKNLAENNVTITEHRLRDILEYLNKNNYIYFGKGRAGTIITKSGEDFLSLLMLNK